MKRITVAFTFFLASSLIGVNPSYAVFGLSQCEKVKKQVVQIEKRITVNLRAQSIGFKKLIPIDSGKGNSIYNAHLKTGELLQSVWKLGTNNPKCFSNTQKILIKDKEYWWPNTWITVLPQQGSWMTYEVNKYTSILLR